MRFTPRFCPYESCAAHTGQRFSFQSRGSYRRKCDGETVSRFSCNTCGRRFSRQSFRFNYRWWRPTAHIEVFRGFISKVTMRQIARNTGYSRDLVTRRMRALGQHCRRLHQARTRGSGLVGVFQLDEGETFETDRLLKPVTVPVVVETSSLFVVYTGVGPLPARGRLDSFRRARKEAHDAVHGRRVSGSRQAVESALLALREAMSSSLPLMIRTDRKTSYKPLVRRIFEGRIGNHLRISSKAPRNRKNPLFAVNHTLGMIRDGVSRMVRRSWAASKLRSRLEEHLWIWVCYRNYVREITVKDLSKTPAMAAGVVKERDTIPSLCKWRWPERMAV